MKVSEIDRITRIFPLPISTVSNLNEAKINTTEPSIWWEKNLNETEMNHFNSNFSCHLLGGSRSVFQSHSNHSRDTLGRSCIKISISLIKVSEDTLEHGEAVGEKTWILRDVKLWLWFSNRRVDGVFAEGRICGGNIGQVCWRISWDYLECGWVP